jgi:hypothetical protein
MYRDRKKNTACPLYNVKSYRHWAQYAADYSILLVAFYKAVGT